MNANLWDPQCTSVAAHLMAQFESQALQLVARAYTCIKLKAMATMVGCTAEEAAQSELALWG